MPTQTTSDAKLPVAVDQYARTVLGANIGYDLTFTLATCFLQALREPGLDLLVVGAGAGREIEQFLPDHPAWRLTGVDPSPAMLDAAKGTVSRLGLSERVTLLQGTIDDLSLERRFDAATCMYVLHFLPGEAKLALLRGVAARLNPGAPLFLVTGVRAETRDLGDYMQDAWQQHGELHGLPAEQMAGIIQQISAQASSASSPTAEDYLEMLHAAGFPHVAPVLNASCGSHGSLVAWVARTAVGP